MQAFPESEQIGRSSEELNESELKFNEVEGLLRETENLESLAKDLAGQLDRTKTPNCKQRQEERERSQERISARKLAEDRFASAEKEQNDGE